MMDRWMRKTVKSHSLISRRAPRRKSYWYHSKLAVLVGLLMTSYIRLNLLGSGLNLTACNNVILVDLWWNPALEVRILLCWLNTPWNISAMQDQAFDRAHRFGQKRDVNIFKLKIDDTVEDRILLVSAPPCILKCSPNDNLNRSCRKRNALWRRRR